MLNTRG